MAQSLAADLPIAILYDPAGHAYCVTNCVAFGQKNPALHTVVPSSTPVPTTHPRPAGHATQALALVAATAVLYVPATHEVAIDEPATQYVPALHACGCAIVEPDRAHT
jgi:hypothetical protein